MKALEAFAGIRVIEFASGFVLLVIGSLRTVHSLATFYWRSIHEMRYVPRCQQMSNLVGIDHRVFLKKVLHKREEKIQEKMKMTLQKDKNLA